MREIYKINEVCEDSGVNGHCNKACHVTLQCCYWCHQLNNNAETATTNSCCCLTFLSSSTGSYKNLGTGDFMILWSEEQHLIQKLEFCV